MKEYITEYYHNGKRYGSEIFAKNIEEAEKILKSKQMSERILGCDPTINFSTD